MECLAITVKEVRWPLKLCQISAMSKPKISYIDVLTQEGCLGQKKVLPRGNYEQIKCKIVAKQK